MTINTLTLPSWQGQLANLIDDIDTLCDYLALDKSKLMTRFAIPPKFALKVPYAFADKMVKGDLDDPLLKQVLPSQDERIIKNGYTTDPLAENDHNPIKGLLHKYQSRVLITLTGACAIHCRYCFRQHFDYHANLPKGDELHNILTYINACPQVNEVILSGGDPLCVSNRRLTAFLQALASTNISTIRLHTRLPVVLPDRVDNELLDLLVSLDKAVVMVIHSNHPNELGDDTKWACQKLKTANVTLLNQSVLLKGINDNADILAKLSHRLLACGVLPYYLHLLDKVAGASHFEIDESQAVQLYWELLERLAGYLVPKLVQELPHRPYKTPVDIYKYKQFG